MKTLPYDISRCVGRFDLLPDGEWCPHRDTCQRYLAWTQWDREDDIPSYRGIPVMTGMRDCEHKIELEVVDE